jgi:hypothetical protein
MVGMISLGDVGQPAATDLLTQCVKGVSAHHRGNADPVLELRPIEAGERGRRGYAMTKAALPSSRPHCRSGSWAGRLRWQGSQKVSCDRPTSSATRL